MTSPLLKISPAIMFIFMAMLLIDKYLGFINSAISFHEHIHTLLILFISLSAVIYIVKISPLDEITSLSDRSSDSPDFLSHLTFSPATRRIFLSIVIGCVIFAALLMLYDPIQFRDISSDQKAVENFAALFSFLSSVIFVVSGFMLRKCSLQRSKLYSFAAWFFAVVFFVITMEEIAWTQGIFHFATPKIFEGNAQGEMNIHNYATLDFERAYYFGTCVFFVILPFLNDKFRLFGKLPLIEFFTPSRFLVYIYAIASGWNYASWFEDSYPKLFYFLTIIILAYYTWVKRLDDHPLLARLLIAALLISQIIFLTYGYTVPRASSFKEYKEFFIPFSFLSYSLEIRLRAKTFKR